MANSQPSSSQRGDSRRRRAARLYRHDSSLVDENSTTWLSLLGNLEYERIGIVRLELTIKHCGLRDSKTCGRFVTTSDGMHYYGPADKRRKECLGRRWRVLVALILHRKRRHPFLYYTGALFFGSSRKSAPPWSNVSTWV